MFPDKKVHIHELYARGLYVKLSRVFTHALEVLSSILTSSNIADFKNKIKNL